MSDTASARMATLSGGVSTQKSEVRSPGQLDDGLNIDLQLKRGMARRAGTLHVAALGASMPATIWHLSKTIEGGAKPRVIVGSDGTVQVINEANAVATVQVDAAVATYLAVSGSTRPHCAGVNDSKGVIRIANSGVTPEATRSENVNTSGQRETYASLEAFTPTSAIGQVWTAKEGSDARPAGVYRYTPGTGTYATAQFAAYVAGTAASDTLNLCAASQNPRGFRLFYSKFIVNAGAIPCGAGTSAGTTIDILDLTAVSGITSYIYQAGDEAYVEGGTATAGSYPIAFRSGSLIGLVGTTGGAGGNVNVRGIGRMVEINENFHTNPVASMDDAADRYTQALRNAGIINACVHWDWTNMAAWTGKFTITAGDGGPMSGFSNTTYTVFAPTIAGANDDTAATPAFTLAPTITPGTGAFEKFTTTPKSRWTPVALPDQADALLDPTTMPVSLRQIDVTSYANTAIDLGAWHFYRLGDSTVNTTAKDSAGHSIGTYTNAPTRNVATLVTGDGDHSTTFDGTNDHVAVATWWPIGNQSSITVEMLVKTTTAAIGERCLFHLKQTNDLYVTMNKTAANRITVYAGGGEYYFNVANFNDGALKHVAVVCTATAITLYVNGALQAATVTTAVTGNPGIGSSQGAYSIDLGRRHDNTLFFAGTLDEVAVYPFAMTATAAAYRSAQATTNTGTGDLWTVELTDWDPRTTGDSTTNPTPSFVRNAQPITAMTVWQGRFSTGAGRVFGTSQAQNETAFFVNDISVVTDAAPIDRIVANADASTITGLVPFGSICFAQTDGPTHYELSATGALTIGTINSRAGLSRVLSDTIPVLSGERLYILGPGDGEGGGLTLLESTLNEQAVQASYDDIGQHYHGKIDTAGTSTFEMVAIPTDGKVLLVQIGTGNIFVYQTAYVGDEKRQSAWAPWTVGGTIVAACAYDGGLSLVVLRSGKYLLEFWQPQAEEAWPTASARMDGQVTLTGGVFAAGNTTWATPTNVPATGIDRIVTAAGIEYTVTGTGTTVTLAGVNLNGQTVTAGRWFDSYGDPSRVFVRDGQQQAVLSRDVTLAYAIVTASDVSKVRCLVKVDSRADVDYPVSKIRADSKLGKAPTRGPAGRTRVRLSMPGVAPVSIGTMEQIIDAVRSRT